MHRGLAKAAEFPKFEQYTFLTSVPPSRMPCGPPIEAIPAIHAVMEFPHEGYELRARSAIVMG